MLTASNITFGRKYRSLTTALVGIATALITYKSGSPKVLLEGLDNAGRPFESWNDVADVDFVD